jgi:hypothetical protein
MHNRIAMTIVKGTQDLSGKFSCVLFSQFAMTDDIIQHLSTVDILKEEIEMSLSDYDVPHSTNVWMP